MFDALVITKREKPGLRALVSIPVAAALHLVLGGLLLVRALYGPVEIAPPETRIRFLPAPPAIPVQLQPHVTKPPAVTGPKSPPPATPFRAPSDVPTGIQPAPPVAVQNTSEPDPSDQELFPPGPGNEWSDPRPPAPALVPDYSLPTPPRLLHQVDPGYPPALRAMGTPGRVVLKLTVDEEGRVAAAEVVTSTHPLFTESALAAVRQWRYTRSVDAGGNSVLVITFVTVNFTLR